ncbi:hypothetical protein Ctob_002769 [Chrysochromulina tobinii]|uniref:Uncharacterized protein n=1 Tax=Chrysochromulina tobinii TaxID=1460289 RepID=A0A0M0JD61_9EUKA|nr:hypothetical protein Ctob_002769 [Chrysochromulina tobinii]|eukprot:KOO24501.1 hypothetical protein Ctob_002769 [Chrysochromulina sp. CCMP291]
MGSAPAIVHEPVRGSTWCACTGLQTLMDQRLKPTWRFRMNAHRRRGRGTNHGLQHQGLQPGSARPHGPRRCGNVPSARSAG